MNILLNTNLTKRTKLSLFKGKIIPIILSEKITKIHIITDSKGPYSKKISYHCPPKIISKNGVARLFYRILLSFSVSIKYRPQIYFGFFTIPHGFISVLCSKFFARPSVIYIMGGKREFTEALNFSAKSRFPLGILETPLHSFFTSSDHFVVTGLGVLIVGFSYYFGVKWGLVEAIKIQDNL